MSGGIVNRNFSVQPLYHFSPAFLCVLCALCASVLGLDKFNSHGGGLAAADA
jgi:hypothetical protein